jgi:hypothetical protein
LPYVIVVGASALETIGIVGEKSQILADVQAGFRYSKRSAYFKTLSVAPILEGLIGLKVNKPQLSWQLYSGVPGACRLNKAAKASSSAARAKVKAMAAKPANMKREAAIMIDCYNQKF